MESGCRRNGGRFCIGAPIDEHPLGDHDDRRVGPSGDDASMTTTSDIEKVLGSFEDARKHHNVVGATMAVLAEDQVHEVAGGVLNVETGFEVDTRSVFQIGSITKSYTATLAMQLVDEGTLDL